MYIYLLLFVCIYLFTVLQSPSPFDSRKGKHFVVPGRGLTDISASNTNSANSFSSQEPVKGSRHQVYFSS